MKIPVAKLLCETRRVFQALAEATDEVLHSRGLSALDRGLLKALAQQSAPVTVASLARMSLTPATETALALAAMRDRGWVDCHGDAPDTPGTMAMLNQRGRACWAELQASEQVLIERLGAELDGQAVLSTFATLRAVRRLLERTPAPASPQAASPSRNVSTNTWSTRNRMGPVRRPRCA